MLAFESPERRDRIRVAGTGSLLPPLPGAAKADGEGQEGGAAPPTREETRALLENNLYDRSLVTGEVLALRRRMSVGKIVMWDAPAEFARRVGEFTAPG